MPVLDRPVARLARITVLDRPTAWLSEAVGRVTHRSPVSSILGGTWLGHPLHPALTDVPIGCWTAAVLVDLAGGPEGRRTARFLVGAGVLAAVPTAVTGLADWADTGDERRRIGAVHGLVNLGATTCFALSWLARRRRRDGMGPTLSLAGTVAMTAGAVLGGHLVYRAGTGVDVNAFDTGPDDWTPPDGSPQTVAQAPDAVVIEAGRARVLATRGADGRWRGIGARCSHRDGPLEEGWFDDDCVTCPWHHSRFRLADGSLVDGPATAPQPRYEVSEREGTLLVRAAPAPAP
jgi:nitrite reductase/ring-hydroxylating ferredoxin subunit/uncharacterized membrane protein